MSRIRPPLAPRLSPNVVGALWIFASSITFTLMTTLVKLLGHDYSAEIQTLFRQAAAFAIVLPVILHRRSAAFATRRPVILIFRAAGAVAALNLAFYGFQKMPLAEANALSYTRALWLVPLAALIVREKVGPLRIAAVTIGFIGVLVMVSAGWTTNAAITRPAAAMLLSSLLSALSVTGTKIATKDHSATVLLVWSATLGLVFAAPAALLRWQWPAPWDLTLLCLMGAMGVASQACYIKGIQAGDTAAMAPMEYIRLIFAAAMGYWLFGETPTALIFIGASIIIVATLSIAWREHHLYVRQTIEDVDNSSVGCESSAVRRQP